ncbi:ADP-ribosylglycohydrolase [Catellatospora methionotrophica]|uniref:ADP-ribosylglycohydrolase n=1 Tax=Catellatospora methionotrophica TaxID=121620 RepID=A0A8J3LI94_9ACTN|nr:ADP-ribosylglycohydrolase family protein [Catellatospora methionotrophica]GIG18725.1 ADP-ribosylglycohydrolase [Catellatospora methionotrophica]
MASAPDSTTGRPDRVAGALLGVHAGDALGATVEFDSWEYIRFRYPGGVREIMGGGVFEWPPGHATDDTDLTRAVALAYLDPGDDVVLAAARRMLNWYEGDWPGRAPGRPPVDVGGATEDGLRAFAQTGDPGGSGAGPGRAGNGSLMRCIPTALAVRDRDRRIRDSMRISAVTHSDVRCTVACAAYNEIVAALVDGVAANGAVAAGAAVARELHNTDVLAAIALGERLDLAELARTGVTGLPDDGNGYVLDSLALAVAAVLDLRDLTDVLIDIVALGNDSDTNAAIAGGLLGARDGASSIPDGWLSLLQFRVEFTEIAAVFGRR